MAGDWFTREGKSEQTEENWNTELYKPSVSVLGILHGVAREKRSLDMRKKSTLKFLK